MKRRKQRRLTSSKSKTITCVVCKNIFYQLKHFKQHLTDRPNCKSKSPYACKTCGKFVGHNEQSFDLHLTKNISCKFYYEERNVASGLLNDSTLPCIKSNNNCNDVTSCLFKRYSTDGVVDNVQLNLKDDSVQKWVQYAEFLEIFLNEWMSIHT